MGPRLVMRQRLAALLALLLATGAMEAVAQARPAADRFAPVRASIQRFLDSTGTASLAVAVAKDGRVVWEEAFGWANRETRTPATVHTMYSLASISKPITATGLMVLVERGLVDLDQPVNRYLGAGRVTGRAGPAEAATVRRVASHTAGLPLHYQFFYEGSGYGPPTMDETIARYANVVFEPGAVYQYSNLGYGILDHVVERVSGQRFADFMRAEVFLPLGLTRTSIDIGPGLAPYAAERYDARQRPIPFYTFDHNGGSAVYSSAHDLVRYGMFFLKNRLPGQRQILSDRAIDEMHRPMAPASYGVGWAVTPDDLGYRRVAHSGGMPGVATLLWLYPTENLAVTMLVNGNARPEAIAQDLVGVMLPRYADSLRASRARATPARPEPFRPGADLAGDWRGTVRTWKDTLAITLSIRPDGEVRVRLGSQLPAVLDQPAFRDGRLSGRMWGRIPTDDAGRHFHVLQLDVRLTDGTLRGMVSAQTPADPVLYYSLASYAELRRER
jgi:CubicO group peptidase (beta-lactamase class C family)